MRGLLLVACLAGCASAENALPDPTPAADLSATADDLLLPPIAPSGGDGGGSAPADLATGCSAAEHVVVNEVQTTGSASASDEFIELFNPCAKPVDLSNWTLVYHSAANNGDSPILTLANGQIIAGGGYLLFATTVYTGAAKADQTYGATGKLAQAGGGIGLRNTIATLIDSVGWGTATNNFVEGKAASAPAAGQSIARTPNGADSDHNNVDFAVAATPTPRAAN